MTNLAQLDLDGAPLALKIRATHPESQTMISTQLDAASLLNALPAGVVAHGPDTQILYANPMALKILRLTQAQIVGKNAMDPHWKFVDRFKSPLPLDAYPVNLVLARDAALSDYVVGIMDGSTTRVTWVMVNAYPERSASGGVERVVVTFVDISQTHKEIPFDSIVELANDVIVITKANPLEPEIVYVNQAFSRLTGYTAAEVMGKTPRFLQRTETDPQTRARIRDALSNGHDVGDLALQHFASLVRAGFRSSDVAARFGGEEFVVLLHGIGEAEGVRILNQFREKVAAATLPLHDGTVLHLTVSIGLTTRLPGEDPDMLKRADLAMYEAKHSGRNCVVAR